MRPVITGQPILGSGFSPSESIEERINWLINAIYLIETASFEHDPNAVLIDENGNVGIGIVPTFTLDIAGVDVSKMMQITGVETTVGGIVIGGRKARGTIAAPLTVNAEDTIVAFRSIAYGSTQYNIISNIRTVAQSVSGDNISCKIEFRLNDTSGTLQTRFSIDENGDATFGGWVKTGAVTVANLPTASSAGASARHFVTDANATTFASIVAGSGSNGVPVYSDGTNWRIG